MNENLFREKYMEIQLIDKQIKQIQNQIQQINEQEMEVDFIVQNLEDMKSVVKGDIVLVPISNGIFMKAKVEDVEHLNVNVGSHTVVEKTIEETQQMMLDQTIEIRQVHTNLMDTLQKLTLRARKTEQEVQELIKDYEKNDNV